MATRWQTGFAETDDTEHALARRSVAPGIYAVPVTDWTVILTSIGTASVAGVVGFKAAAMQARVSLRGIEAENGRLREQHKEDHFRHRQGVYHDFLDAEMLLLRAGMSSEGDLQVVLAGFSHARNAVLLFGSEPVKEAAESLFDFHIGVADRAAVLIAAGGSENPVRDAYRETGDTLMGLRETLVAAMRTEAGHALPSST